ncbi:MAG: single-stranded DNA-binding protein, partial [Candidatus Kapaibacteriota bacterium]
TSETWKDKDGAMQEHTDWHTVIAWRGLADIVERLVHRGSRIYVEGKIQTRSYDDREGQKRYVTEIVAENILLLDAKRSDASMNGSVGEPQDSETGSEDIPF